VCEKKKCTPGMVLSGQQMLLRSWRLFLIHTPAGGLCLRGGWPEERGTAVLPAGGYRTCPEQKLL